MIKWLISKLRGVQTAAAPSETHGRTDTEFTAEVVRITSVNPHPNADRLEIARFELKGVGETTYEVVVGKSDFKPGDLAAYFSVDCILPTSHPDFAFLTKRLDGAGKSHFRLRAARIRKHFSQGLLVPNNFNLNFGDDCSVPYGVTYHEPVVKGTPFTPGFKKVVIQPAPIYGVDSLKKAPRLFNDGEAVFITEKIHGTNFRFGWVRRKVFGIPFGWKFFVGSHRTVRGTDGKSWYGSDLYAQAADHFKLRELTKGHKGMVFYGELYGYTFDGSPIQPGFPYGRTPTTGPGLAIFDIRNMSLGCWLRPFDRMDILLDLNLQSPPVLGLIQSFNLTLVRSGWEGLQSRLDKGTLMEGVVVEAHDGLRRKGKYVHEAYLEAKHDDV